MEWRVEALSPHSHPHPQQIAAALHRRDRQGAGEKPPMCCSARGLRWALEVGGGF